MTGNMPPDGQHSPWPFALAGMGALAIAMGIGRFAFTPLLPMMLHDGVLDLGGASWLASANYLGYLIGALLCTAQPWLWRLLELNRPPDGARMVRFGLVATTLLTLAMATPWQAGWAWWRLAAGVASAVVFVFTSNWCLAQLAARQASPLGGVIYTGPGLGIVLSGLIASALVAMQSPAWVGWIVFGCLAALLTAAVWRRFLPEASVHPSTLKPSQAGQTAQTLDATRGAIETSGARGTPGKLSTSAGAMELAMLAVGYGMAGFGYIITATFLPVIARTALPDSTWLDLFWPLLGLGIIVGALLATRLRPDGDARLRLCACFVVQALGVVACLISPTLAGFALGSLLLGLPFTAITFFAMQEARRLRPHSAASYMGLLTALYGLGQIGGPPLAATLIARTGSATAGFTLALEAAAGTLLVGAAIFGVMVKAFRHRDP